MADRVKAVVRPEILAWARRSAGLELAEAAKKARVDPERLQGWEEGTDKPTLKQLRKLGAVYKRPIVVFYLPEPPRDFKAMHDFRRLPDAARGVLSPEFRFEIRRAQDRRELAIELWQSIEGTAPEFPLKASLQEDPEGIASRIREALGVSYEMQTGWTGYYQHFNKWRSALEAAGILVFQASHVETAEMRGFSIGEQPLPAVVVNIKDSPPGRAFTMLHELSHIMLCRSGVCDLHEMPNAGSEDERVEVFCNRVAGAALVPASCLLREQLVTSKAPNGEWADDEIRTLASLYGVSRETLVRRLLLCGRVAEGFYRRKREQYQKEHADRRRQTGFVPPDVMAIAKAGRLFVRLVLNNYYQDRVTASDVADFLEVRLKHLGKIEAELQGQAS